LAPPATTNALVWVMLPVLAVTLRFPVPTFKVPRLNEVLFNKITLLAPLLVRETLPVKWLPALLSVIQPALAVKQAFPAATKAPDCVIHPVVAVKLRFPAGIVIVPKARVVLFVRAMSLAPLFTKETLPVK